MATIQITIPDQYVSRVATAFGVANAEALKLSGNLNGPMSGSESLRFDMPGAITTPVQKAALMKTAIRQYIRAVVILYELNVSQDIYSQAIAQMPAPSVDVPDDLTE